MDLSSLRYNKYITPAAVMSSALALGATACGNARPQTCESLYAAHHFKGDHSAGVIEGDQNTWQTGIELDTQMPPGATALRVEFTDPGGNWHASDWISSDDAEHIAMREGPIDTTIRTQMRAPNNSPLCQHKPPTKFVIKPYVTLIYEEDTVPQGWHQE